MLSNFLSFSSFLLLIWISHGLLLIFTGKLSEKLLLGRPKRRWEDNMRIDLKEIGVSMVKWIDSAQNRDYWRVLVNAAFS